MARYHRLCLFSYFPSHPPILANLTFDFHPDTKQSSAPPNPADQTRSKTNRVLCPAQPVTNPFNKIQSGGKPGSTHPGNSEREVNNLKSRALHEPSSPPVQVKLDCSDYPCHDSASATGHHAKPDPRKLRAGLSGLSSNPWQPDTISKQGSEPSSTQSRVLSPAQPILADLTLSFRTNQRQGSGPTPAHHVC